MMKKLDGMLKEMSPAKWQEATPRERIPMIPLGVLSMTKARYNLYGFFPAVARVFSATYEMTSYFIEGEIAKHRA